MGLNLLFVMVGVLWATGSAAIAAPALPGYSGLTKVPTAETLVQGNFVVGFSWVSGPRSILFRPLPNRMYYASIGLLPGLELTLDMLQVVGWSDPSAPGVEHAFHRLSHAKYQLLMPGWAPAMALGIQDPFSANALTRGPVGQTNYGLTTYYGVISQAAGPVTFHAGYATSRSFLRGGFFGAEWELMPGLRLRSEYDSQEFNMGVFWQPFDWLSLRVDRLFPDDWAAGTAVTWRL